MAPPHITFGPIIGRRRGKRYPALTGISAANYYRTPDGGGEPGDAAGFGEIYLCRVRGFDPAAQQFLGGRRATGGHQLNLGTTGVLSFFAWATSSTYAQASGTFPTSKIGRLCLITAQHTGSLLRLLLDRMELLGSAAIAGYYPAAPATQWEYWGVGHVGNEPSTKIDYLARLAFRGVPSDAQLTAYLDAARALGDLPNTLSGATVTRHWSLRAALAGVAVTPGQTAPAALADSVSGDPAHAMNRQGSVSVTLIDGSTDGRKLCGALGFTATSFLETAAGLGIRGAPTGFRVAIGFTPRVLTGVSILAACYDGTKGWMVLRNAASLYVQTYPNNATAIGTPARTLVASELGLPMQVELVHNGTRAELRVNGASISTAANAAYSAPAGTAKMLIGTAAGNVCTEDIYSIAGEDGSSYSTAELDAAYAAFLATGRVQNVPGKANPHHYDLTADIAANGGPEQGFPTTVQDRAGASHLTKVGGGLQVAQRVDRTFSFETTSIVEGGRTWTQANQYMSNPGVALGDAAGFWLAYLLLLPSGASSASRFFASNKSVSPPGGWDARALGANTALSWGIYDATPALQTSPSAIITAAEQDRLQLFVGVWDGPQLKQRSFFKRAEIGTGFSRTGYTPAPASTSLSLGYDQTSLGNPGDVVQLFGFAYGIGVPILAQIQALYDSVQANEKMMAMPGGTTQHLVRFGGLPAVINDLQGSAVLTRTGAPAAASVNSRVWGW